jgi:hypothetical protein
MTQTLMIYFKVLTNNLSPLQDIFWSEAKSGRQFLKILAAHGNSSFCGQELIHRSNSKHLA